MKTILTDEEIKDAAKGCYKYGFDRKKFTCAIEAAILAKVRAEAQSRIENPQNLYTSKQRVQKSDISVHITEEEEEAFMAISDRLSPT